MMTFHIAPWVLPILGSALMLGIYDISKKQAVKDNSVLPALFWSTTIGSIFFLLLTGAILFPVFCSMIPHFCRSC